MDDARDSHVHATLTAEGKAILKKVASACGLNISNWIEQAARAEYDKKK